MTIVDLEGRINQYNDPVPQEQAETLGAKVMAAAADVAKQDAVFLELVGEFDAMNAARWWSGVQSTAHWLSWACSIAPGTAREHVRVARALRRMPLVKQSFAVGELTYSKVREITRVADRVEQEDLDEAGLVEFARACTASQLARTVTGWRAATGASRERRSRQRVSWVVQADGSVHLTAVLPAEEGAALIAAVQSATDANTEPDPDPGEELPDEDISAKAREERLQQTRVQALTEIANHYLGSRPEDRSGEDRTMVVLEVSAAALADADERSRGNAPEQVTVPTCRVRGGGAIEVSDAYRALCDSTILGVIVDNKGMPLAVGREERLVTKHQRRALMVRDGCCQFPGCHRTRRLKAHHRVSWLDGGLTDLDNLILLCQFHHTRVHEDRITITACDAPGCRIPWRFNRPDGSAIAPIVAGLDAPSPWRPGRGGFRADNDRLVAQWEGAQEELRDQAARLRAAYEHIHDTRHPDARRVFPVGGGDGFNLIDCVDALFHFTKPLPAAA